MLRWFTRRLAKNDQPAVATTATPAPAPTPAPVAPLPAAEIHLPHDKIAARAAEIWDRKGRPHGLDAQNWAEAEAELRAEYAANPAPEQLPRKSR